MKALGTPIRLVGWLLFFTLLMACQSKEPEHQSSHNESADLAAIERLHQQDMAAAKVWDVETLVSLWTDDIVTLPQERLPVIGKEANRAELLKMREASREVKIEDYTLSFKEIKLAGDWAFEWGTFAGTVRPVAGGEVMKSSGKLMRVLRRQADGSWKVARSMYSNDPTPTPSPGS